MAPARKTRPRGVVSAPVDRHSATAAVDRLVVSALLLVLAGAGAYVFLVALGVLDGAVRLPSGQTVDQLLGLAGGGGSENRVMVGAVSLLLGLLFTGVLVARLTGGASGEARERGDGVHILSADEGGLVVVDTVGVRNVATAAVQVIPGVVDVKVTVRGSGGAPVKLELVVSASAAAEQHTLGERARERARDAVQRLVGLEVQEVSVRMNAVSLEDLGRMLR